MFENPQFWVAVSFIVFVAAVYKPVGKLLAGTLDGRAAKIQKELDEALRLKEEAQALLASYQHKQKEAAEEAARVLKNAEEEAARIVSEAEILMEENLNKKIQLAMQKIASYEHSVMQDVRTNSIDIAIGTVRKLTKERLTEEIAESLVSRAMNEMNKKLH